MIIPPIKNPPTAIKDSKDKLLKPIIPWPEVHPPAYLEPNPTKTPATRRIKNPFTVSILSILKISSGKKVDPALLIPI